MEIAAEAVVRLAIIGRKVNPKSSGPEKVFELRFPQSKL
jgi:hypothetical protein